MRKFKKGRVSRARAGGYLGEHYVDKILANALSTDEYLGKSFGGADFFVPDYYGKGQHHFIEVKSTFDSDGRSITVLLKERSRGKTVWVKKSLFKPPNSITLRLEFGEWSNKRSHEIIIVTEKMVYFGRSDDLRDFIAQNSHRFKHYKNLNETSGAKREGVENIFVPIKELASRGIVEGVPKEKIVAIAKFVAPEKKPLLKKPKKRGPATLLGRFMDGRERWPERPLQARPLSSQGFHRKVFNRRMQMGLPGGRRNKPR